MLDLPGYQATEMVYQGSRTAVYRAVRLASQQATIVKVLRHPNPPFKELAQFRNQFLISRHLDSSHIVRPLALERYGNSYALIMPDTGAIALAGYWQGGVTAATHQTLAAWLQIAIQIATALHDLAKAQIIHKDLKPANILIHPETGQVQLIDFSIATRLPKTQQQQLVNPEQLEGTLAYISPEQTGRMNRGVDYRTDFYSLGVTLYELLIGDLPFASSDPLEVIHQQIARAPLSPQTIYTDRGESCPQAVSAIVLKLMAKNAEDRYQSALGLKHDLEQCWQSLQEIGKIANFDLGRQDVCDRFSIPEKLYGREEDVQQLLDAFARAAQGHSELMLVAGFSGIGKTAVVKEVHKPIAAKRGYFVQGKFDQLNRNVPFSAFVQACRDLVRQVLSESNAAIARWQSQLLAAVGDSSQVLVEAIPELTELIGPQTPAPELSGSAARNRFNRLFSAFLKVFAQAEHPLTIFLDDLQWADSASLGLLTVLMGDRTLTHLLLLAAYRDNEVVAGHPLQLSLKQLLQQQIQFSTLRLYSLAATETNQLVADTLSCSLAMAQPLTDLLYPQTQGNPFFTTRLLEQLHKEQLIQFDRDAGCWECDLVRIRRLTLTDDVVELMTQQLGKLPSQTQQAIQFAACVGNVFDLATLAIVLETTPNLAATALWPGLEAGFILPQSEASEFYLEPETVPLVESSTPQIVYRFLHDRVQQAAYALIPDAQKQATHLKIGQLLQRNREQSESSSQVFEIVNQLNKGCELLTDSGQQQDLAQLNLQAAQQAQAAIAYAAALDYSHQGIALLDRDCWHRQYDLALALYNCAANNAYLSGDFAVMEQRLAVVLREARSRLDRIAAYETKIEAAKAQDQRYKAVQIGLEILTQLGIRFPASPNPLHLGWALGKSQLLRRGRPIAELTQLPLMTQSQALAAMRILAKLNPAAYFATPDLFPLLMFKQLALSLRRGNAPESVFAYATYGISLCGILDNIESGYAFGRLALDLLDELNVEQYRANILFVFNFLIRHWKEPLRNSLSPLMKAYQVGLDVGDLEMAAFALQCHHFCSYCTGKELSELQIGLIDAQAPIAKLNQTNALLQHNLCLQIVSILVEEDEDPRNLTEDLEEALQEIAFNRDIQDPSTICFLHIQQMILAYLFGNSSLAQSYAQKAIENIEAIAARLDVVLFYFYQSLVQLDLYPEASETEQRKIKKQLKAGRKKFKDWVRHSPQNNQHKLDLIEAERFRIEGKTMLAIDAYERAIVGASQQGYRQEAAIANERAALFYWSWNKPQIARVYLQAAYADYADWGAKAKIQQLETTYPEIFPRNLTPRMTQSSSGTITTNRQTLDFASALKASQALSEEIELESLVTRLIQLILENAGASKGILLLEHNETWEVAAQCQEQGCQLKPGSSVSLPHHIFDRVKRSRAPLLIEDVAGEMQLLTDIYFHQSAPKSLVCLPLLKQGKLKGILYLENNLAAGAFTPNRLDFLNLLAAQAAISLENAQLYQNLEDYSQTLEETVKQRTQELQDNNQVLNTTLMELQQAQAQLVHSEKMSSLGQLVGGLAHEINNPVSFIHGNLTHAKTYTIDLLDLLSLYQQYNPDPHPEIHNKQDEIDLEFLKTDAIQIFKSMRSGTDRIRDIVKSLRSFSRLDESDFKAVNLHEGIDSSLIVLQTRLRAQDWRPEIQVIKHYGDLPLLECYAGQLNQVFLSLLSNAIDAVEEQSRQQGSQWQGTITLQTQLDRGQVSIRVSDNGSGMSPATQAKVFDPFFTTKDVGKGTGMGMAIAYQIVAERHSGTIACTSELGRGTTFLLRLPMA
ncbi:MAG: AAA family ATPase [Geitlerinemataceae cyanobacterium]